MPKIVLSGYYGFQNTGDEAVLFSILEALRQEIAGAEITVLSNDPVQTSRAYQVPAVNRWQPRQVLTALKEADLLLSGGGSLLQDVTGRRSLYYYLGVIFLAQLLKKPVAYYAQGIGPLRSPSSRRLVKWVSNRAELITVRDEESARLLAAMGVNRVPIRLTADPVFGLDPARMALPGAGELWEREGIEPAPVKVALAVRKWPPAGLEESLAEICRALTEQGCQVVLWPFHYPADQAYSRSLTRYLDGRAVVLKQNYNLPQMLALAGEFDLVVGMRLHALILAVLMGVPCAGLAYDPKVEALLRELEQPLIGRVDELKPGEAGRRAAAVLEKLPLLQEKLRLKVPALHAKALDNARLIKALLQ